MKATKNSTWKESQREGIQVIGDTEGKYQDHHKAGS